MTSITIPDSIIQIGANPFENCYSLKTINVSSTHPTLAVINGVLVEKTEKRLVCYPCAFTSSSYAIPHGIKIIGDFAFSNCSSLTSITIPDSVTDIEYYAFSWCDCLTSISIPNSVIYIWNFAFCDCYSLTSISIPDSVSAIGYGAFLGCDSLTDISVSRGSYAEQYCKDNGLPYNYPDANDWLLN